MDTVFDFAPLWRSGVGFAHLLELAEKAIKLEPTDKTTTRHTSSKRPATTPTA
jgi:hypothetical protein